MLDKIVNSQKEYFKKGNTKNIGFRIEQLKKLRSAILKNETDIMRAIRLDLGRADTEIYTSEIYTVIYELDLFIKNLRKWVRPGKIKTPLALKPGKSRVYLEPLGTVLILAPWNYPFQLLFAPLTGAIAAGNCVTVKPSEVSSNTAGVISGIIKETFERGYIDCIEGGPGEAEELTRQAFGHIFFTGSAGIGRRVLRNAAENLTPVTLELGGKCPCIVTEEAPLRKSARRIAWGKFFNAGQTCLAPDYILAHSSIKEELVKELRASVKGFYGGDPSKSSDYGRIINENHFDRLLKLVQGKNPDNFGSDRDKLYISPAVIDNISREDDIMREEIFGPLLPVLEYEEIEEAAAYLSSGPAPLNIYLFTGDEGKKREIIENTSSGAVTVNDVLIQAFSPYLPFGGVGESGMGKYRGRTSLLTFSNRKSLMERSFFADFKYRYPPYKTPLDKLKKYLKLLR